MSRSRFEQRMTARWLEHRWQLVRDEPTHPLLHMALDEVLTLEVGAGRRPPTLRIWEWSANAVILGRFQSVRNEVDEEAAKRHDVTVARRITGGGAMFVEPRNTITYSLYAPESLVRGLSFVDSYEFMDAWVVEALRGIGVNAVYKPINDLSSDKGKIGGAAQTRRAGAVLHHVTMAYDIDAGKMLEVLRIGREKLSDKGSASADKRVTPLREQTSLPRETIVDALVDHFGSSYGLEHSTVSGAERDAAETLRREKFATSEWIYLLP